MPEETTPAKRGRLSTRGRVIVTAIAATLALMFLALAAFSAHHFGSWGIIPAALFAGACSLCGGFALGGKQPRFRRRR